MNPRVNHKLKRILCNIVNSANSRTFFCVPLSRQILPHQSGVISRTPVAALAHVRSKTAFSRVKYQNQRVNMSQTETASRQDLLAEASCVVEADGWIQVGAYNVFAWSVSGVESCIVIKGNDITMAFDMGTAIKESVSIPHVFITHGHTDHIGGLANHVAKRGLFGMKPARYYVPPHLVEPLQASMAAHHQMAETIEALGKVNVIPIAEGDTIKMTSSYYMRAFPTLHRIPSQGYILYKEEKKLKEQYKGLEGFEVAALYRKGEEIHDVVTTPEIAYTGDTIFDVLLNPPNPDILKVKLLITEATFLDRTDASGKSVIEKARSRGHTHLQEIAHNAHIFDDVGHLLLVHFSNKYSPKYVCDSLRDQLPPPLKHKVIPGTVAMATQPTTYAR